MTAALCLSPPTLPIFPTAFSEPFSSSYPFLLKSLKPLNCLSSDASSSFLQNRSFPPITQKEDAFNDEDDEYGDNSDEAINSDSGNIKMPTAPWMKGHLLLPADEVLDLSKPRSKKRTSNAESQKADKSLTEKISGRRGKKAMKKIVQSIEKLQVGSNLVDAQKNWGDTQKYWGDLEGGVFLGELTSDDDDDRVSKLRRKMPWETERTVVFRRVKKEKVPTAAELTLDKELLERLRGEAGKMRKWVKVKKAGVTQAVVDEVHSVWANNELAMLRFDLPLCRNMDRAQEIVETKTGGLVVWSRKDCIVAYRGCNYQMKARFQRHSRRFSPDGQTTDILSNHRRLESKLALPIQSSEPENMDMKQNSQSPELLVGRSLCVDATHKSLYEREGDRLLDGLGPRFVDWWYPKPLPVDGDMLAEVVPGFKPPFRLCPPRVRPQLTDDELMYLRKIARPMPVHFVLGRNSKLQGLAVSILKLWEKTIIAKIAVKWGVQNTNNELMASELKRLTGGVLLLRNKFFIILYRGKDFLPGNIADVVVEREMELKQWQLHEEDARLRAAGALHMDTETTADTSLVGTFSEFQNIQTICGKINGTNSNDEVKLEAEKERLGKELRIQEHKLSILRFKIDKAEKELSRLNSVWKLSEEEPDQELITEEERECFRNIGLKMDSILVLGRRGVFDGLIEGLHQHWKHRELAKVITKQRTFLQVVNTARTLERESGGVLVSIDKLKEGHAIIIYRGKNYKRPLEFAKNLLDKKKALKRSLEMQRLGSLKFFAYQRGKEIADLRLKLADLEEQQKQLNKS